MVSPLCMNRQFMSLRTKLLCGNDSKRPKKNGSQTLLVASQTILCNFLSRNNPKFQEPPIALLLLLLRFLETPFANWNMSNPISSEAWRLPKGFCCRVVTLVLFSFSAEILLFGGSLSLVWNVQKKNNWSGRQCCNYKTIIHDYLRLQCSIVQHSAA